MSIDELNHMQRYLVEEEAEHMDEGSISRREFIRRITLLVGSAVAAGPILLAYGCSAEEATATAPPASTATTAPAIATTAPATETSAPATATTEAVSPTQANAVNPTATSLSTLHVAEDDPAVNAATVEFPATDGSATLMGYLARPAGAMGTLAGVLVIHENKGLTDHIKDVVRRVAKAGYVALGVDLLSREGGTASIADEGQRSAVLARTSSDILIADLSAGLDYMKTDAQVDGNRLGAMGFCFGGGMTWLLATERADLKAAIPYYGPNPPLTAVPKIEAAVLGIYGGSDARITNRVPDLEAALKAANIKYEIKIYEGAGHAFNNDTVASYKAEVANPAWEKAMSWFKTYLV